MTDSSTAARWRFGLLLALIGLPATANAQPAVVRAVGCREEDVSRIGRDVQLVLTGRVLISARLGTHQLSVLRVHESWRTRAWPFTLIETWWETTAGDELLVFLKSADGSLWREVSLCAPNSSPPASATRSQLGPGGSIPHRGRVRFAGADCDRWRGARLATASQEEGGRETRACREVTRLNYARFVHPEA